MENKQRSSRDKAKKDEAKLTAIKNRKLFKQSSIIILFGVAVMGGLTFLLVSQSPSMKEEFDATRIVERPTVVALSVYQDNSEGKFMPLPDDISVNMNLTFKLSTNLPVHTALLASIQQEKPVILFSGIRVPPGKDRLVEKAGDRFIYSVLPGSQELKFCIVHGQNINELKIKLAKWEATWRNLPMSQCVLLNVK